MIFVLFKKLIVLLIIYNFNMRTYTFFIGFLITSTSIIWAQKGNSRVGTSQKFDRVITSIQNMYVDPVETEKLTEDAIIGLLEKLDPHSTYISKEEAADAQSQIDGSFVGIGVRFQIVKDTIMFVNTIPGGPSEKIGVQAGDQLIHVDGELVAGIGLKNSDVRKKLMGVKDTKVKVTVKRKGTNELLDFTITRDKIPIFSVDSYYMIDDKIGYIKLNSFSRSTMEEMTNALTTLKQKGMKQLILDLQDNGGGLLNVAQELADEFLSGNKLIVYSEGRMQPKSELRASKNGMFEKGELVVLVDEFSASASEIVSGAIQDWDRGSIVGRRTFGKGLVQRPIDLIDGSEIRLTIARYYTPTGRFIQKPYDDAERYKKDIAQRYLSGELMHADSIKLPDSLKFKTMITKRDVYSGGGIVPDFFVPLDTSDITDYFSSLNRSGMFNNFGLNYVNSQRTNLKSKYPDFVTFKKNFKADQAFMDAFLAHVEKEKADLKFNAEEFELSKKLIQTRLKAEIAQNLWDYSEFYEIYNSRNEILQKAINILQTKEYLKLNLDRN
jgi:carboxyl-terminal processing protease